MKERGKGIFQDILLPLMNEFFNMPYSVAFHRPVSSKKFPDYRTIVENPIDLTTIKTRIRHSKYSTFDEFLSDIKLIKENCVKYNGPEHSLTKVAENFVTRTIEIGNAEKYKFEEAENILHEFYNDESNL